MALPRCRTCGREVIITDPKVIVFGGAIVACGDDCRAKKTTRYELTDKDRAILKRLRIAED